MYLAPVRTVAPAALPVSLADAKARLRIDHDDEDDVVSALIGAATAHLDGWRGVLGRAIVTQTWRQDLAGFPPDEIRLPLAPVASITSVTYRDGDDATQTLASSNYAGPLEDARGPFIYRPSGGTWPGTSDRHDAVSVTFVAGYGTTGGIPDDLVTAILLLAAHWYEHREAVATGPAQPLPIGVASLIAPYRRVGV